MTNKQKYKQLTKQLNKLRNLLYEEEKNALISKMARKYVGKYFSKTHGNDYTTYFHVLSVGANKNSYPVNPVFVTSAIYISSDNIGYDSQNRGYESEFKTEISKEDWLKAKQQLKDTL